ncbi:VWA domain-containing protein [Thalassobaculum sp. OXR-137]|uniref:vWA domain-containing protein n=1 Tax=Thalassobaculum sp. OXR-137 TaxID=3100173 RepID=UPI002AC8FBAA|nr:VWA domain-containing protein [Thalassobaculum sp. OXR-137]WPZ32819.1 VWA domain-containing protein [Thalassobaculum sp. OXR-137]
MPDDLSPPDYSLPDAGAEGGGKLIQNIMHFGRTLRAAGLPVGPGKVLDAVEAVRVAGITNRRDFYWTLHAVFVNRRDQREIFDQAFHVFWRNPRLLERMLQMILPEFRGDADEDKEKGQEMNRRLAEALKSENPGNADPQEPEEEEIELDAAMTWSDRELLREMDFEKMTAEEILRAKQVIRDMRLPIAEIKTRRFRPSPHGLRLDLRRTMSATMRSGGDEIALQRRKQRTRRPPLVVLCDISGSMSRYSRMLLHFMHAITNDRDRVHTFLFGTRLTNVTRYLKHTDVDEALVQVGDVVNDWSGGTRIGHCLHEFNRFWGRRVLTQGAIVVLITDGLDREVGAGLAGEMDRLHKSCRRLIWLNPLLRYDGFAPKSQGVRAILPHVDDFRPVHSLDSLEQLAEAIGRPSLRRREGMDDWLANLRRVEEEVRQSQSH